ncbi:hypothetical protein RCH16_003688 [Cryobacterium sp. MP_M5]|uniref:hypothetical protein n=1 Tax=unclassified Cryobacterium TaxID=2649013 RepID=UPI0018C8E004|nr:MULTISPECIES: hypothetical protein [unclassified Cryobacterium]MBG6060210.1 hypothetical protein [Cryobacterium sp. MP_M3]MEC5178648.1 hypothetical protein [Cryobacterium sp. MP_M5]
MFVNGAQQIPTRSTTLWGGLGIALAGFLSMAVALNYSLLNDLSFILSSAFSLVSALILMLAVLILAFSIRHETGIAGASKSGKVALVVFGICTVGKDALNLFSSTMTSDVVRVQSDVSFALSVAALVSLVVAAISVAKAGVITGPLRWGVVVFGAWSAITFALNLDPAGTFLFSSEAYVMMLLLQIALGIGFALYGREQALRRRMEVFNQRW